MKYVDPSGHCVQYGGEDGNPDELATCLDAWNALSSYYGQLLEWENMPNEYLNFLLEKASTEEIVSILNGFGIDYTIEETLTGPPRINLSLPDFDAFAFGGSGNVDLPWFIGAKSFVLGGEMVINWESSDITFFIYYGGGTTVGAGANPSGYLALIGNAPNNSAYSGPFVSVDGTGSAGPAGVVAGRAAAPQDLNPFNPPESAYSYYLGYAPGANASLTVNQTEYIPVFSMSWDRRDPFSLGLPQ